MPIRMQNVWSSHVDAIGYDDEKKTLVVKYKTGKTSQYSGVDARTADEVMNAPSIGTALHRAIKGRHEHSYLDTEDGSQE